MGVKERERERSRDTDNERRGEEEEIGEERRGGGKIGDGGD